MPCIARHRLLSILRRQRTAWLQPVLFSLLLQAMFAPGMMPGSEQWVELCRGDGAGVQLVMLDGEESTSGHQDSTWCHWSGAPDGMVSESITLVAFYTGYASSILALSPPLAARLRTSQARAPPHFNA